MAESAPDHFFRRSNRINDGLKEILRTRALIAIALEISEDKGASAAYYGSRLYPEEGLQAKRTDDLLGINSSFRTMSFSPDGRNMVMGFWAVKGLGNHCGRN